MSEDRYDSGQFAGSWYEEPQVALVVPDVPEKSDPKAKMYADVAWFELAHLVTGETCKMNGRREARFWRIEEDTIMCQLPNGNIGVYTHDSDLAWEERRYGAERIATALISGEKLNGW